MSRRNLLLLVATVLVSLACFSHTVHNPHARYVSDGFEKIDAWALDPPADEELVAGAMRGMVDVLRRRGDAHSRYLRPRDAQFLREEISGDFGGVGVRIGLLGEPLQLTVVGPPEPGTPAFFGGVKPNDRIIAIDGEPTAGLSMNEVLDQMRGAVGEPVTLSILRSTGKASDEDEHQATEESIELTLTRAMIHVPSVLGDRRLSDGSWRHMLEQDARIALVRISSFGDHTVEELQELLPQLKDQGMRALVIDLRENAGGALDAAVGACDLFLPPEAPIVETRGRDGDVLERFTARGGHYLQTPIAVLINGNSASASEIMAACLQDNGRATVVGVRSFGKGTVQRLIPLEAGQSLLKLTSASYWRPSGENIHRGVDTPEEARWGVRPDEGYETPLDEEAYVACRKARAERDLIAVDAPDAADDELAEVSKSAAEEAASAEDLGDSKEPAEESSHEHSEPPAPFVDPVLDRAVEALQSRLDASADVKVFAPSAS